MEALDLYSLLFLSVMSFAAGFIDAIVGGGGLITVPALMWTGLPVHYVLGTNKVAAVFGSFTSLLTYARSGLINWHLMRKLFPLSFGGSLLGVLAVRAVPSDVLRPIVVILLLVVFFYSLFKKDWGSVDRYQGESRRNLILSAAIAFVFGFYDGFFGPGTGTFIVFSLLFLGFDFLKATANTKVLNFGSNLAAVFLFIYFGTVNFYYGIVMGLTMIFGSVAGARFTIKRGAEFVRPVFLVITTILIGKEIIKVFFQ